MWRNIKDNIALEMRRGVSPVACITLAHIRFANIVSNSNQVSVENEIMSVDKQRRIQNPVKHLRWSYLRKKGPS